MQSLRVFKGWNLPFFKSLFKGNKSHALREVQHFCIRETLEMNRPYPREVWGLARGQAQSEAQDLDSPHFPSPIQITSHIRAALPWEDCSYLRFPNPCTTKRNSWKPRGPIFILRHKLNKHFASGIILNYLYEHHQFTFILLNSIRLSIYLYKFLLAQIS